MQLLPLLATGLLPAAAAAACTKYASTDFQCPVGSADCDIFQLANVPSFSACCAACAANTTCWAAAYNTEKTCYFKANGALPKHRAAAQGCSCKGKAPPAPSPPPNLCAASATAGYSASVVARSVGPEAGSPLISRAKGTSDLEFNFNTAWFPSNGAGVPEGLVVRVQDNNRYPWWGAAGAVAIVPVNFSTDGKTATAGHVKDSSVVWAGVAAPPALPASICNATGQKSPSQCHACDLRNADNMRCWGAIDPRIAYHTATKTYHLSWDNCSQDCSYRQTQLSTTQNPYDHTSWQHRGPVLGDTDNWADQTGSHQASTAGASFLFDHQPGKHLVFVATGAMAHPQWEQVLMIANSTGDGLRWETMTCNATEANRCCADTSPAAHQGSLSPCLDHDCCSPTPVCVDPDAGKCQNHKAAKAGVGRRVLIAPRLGCWDHGGICAGPQPERLSNGHWLYVYNHDSHNEVNSPSGRCSAGWSILDKDDPTKVIARADKPIVAGCNCSENVPGQGKDCLTCGAPYDIAGQTPQVTFADGLRPMGNDEFVITYGAADQVVGATRIKIHLPAAEGTRHYETSVMSAVEGVGVL